MPASCPSLLLDPLRPHPHPLHSPQREPLRSPNSLTFEWFALRFCCSNNEASIPKPLSKAEAATWQTPGQSPLLDSFQWVLKKAAQFCQLCGHHLSPCQRFPLRRESGLNAKTWSYPHLPVTTGTNLKSRHREGLWLSYPERLLIWNWEHWIRLLLFRLYTLK